MIIKRASEEKILEFLKNKRKVILVYGPRQTGKTTLVKNIGDAFDGKYLYVTADLLDIEKLLGERNINTFQNLTNGYDLLIIDEAQRVKDIGIALKIMYDLMPNLKVIATGSSSFDLANKASESLTGRKKVFHMLPFSLLEIKGNTNNYELMQVLENQVIFGGYPEVYTSETKSEKIELLAEIRDSYLFKDILLLTQTKFHSKLKDLARLLAFQIGREVSINELAVNLKLNHETVINYIDMLEKSFVIFRLSGYSRNLRKEIGKRDKIYFYDTGVRNSLIDNFAVFSARNDVGQLWENFVVAERRKKLLNEGKDFNAYFWRTYTGAELDYIEEIDNELHGYEIKYNSNKFKVPATWKEVYNSSVSLINKENCLDFIL